ncbi:hypothetical protein X772_25115 [Mesorhizobium sp. LSJC280B00]|nr:hypothetical protein X772_25115 [Mesorhizobium sp. LSJC280B00]
MGCVDRNISESPAEIFSGGMVGRPPVFTTRNPAYPSEMIACSIPQAPLPADRPPSRQEHRSCKLWSPVPGYDGHWMLTYSFA